MVLDELRVLAEAQKQSYLRGDATDDTAGLELFRRAITECDEAAREVVVEVYRGLLMTQVRLPVARSLLVQADELSVDQAFQRFWAQTRTGGILEFDDFAGILKYLKLCLGSVLLDGARTQKRNTWVSPGHNARLDGLCGSDPADQIVERLDPRELWRAIEYELADANERLVARLTFVHGLSPSRILALHPDMFPSAFDLYRVKGTMIERLRRSSTVRRLLALT